MKVEALHGWVTYGLGQGAEGCLVGNPGSVDEDGIFSVAHTFACGGASRQEMQQGFGEGPAHMSCPD